MTLSLRLQQDGFLRLTVETGDPADSVVFYLSPEAPANAELPEWAAHPKGELQVRAQAMTPPRHPTYRLLRTEGKAHEPVFTVEVSVEGLGAASASARSHKEAESRAAARLLSMV